MYYLYRHIRLDKNEPFYIGIGTIQIIENKYHYYSRSKEKSNRNIIWNRIVAKTKYKIDILLESEDYDFIKQKEIEFIKLYGRIDLKTGILANMTDGGEGCLNISPESLLRRNQKLTGQKRSEEFKKKLSEDRKGEKNPCFGRIFSKKEKEEISKRMKGHTFNLGKKASETHKKNISESRLGSKHWRSKKVLNIKTNEIFDTVTLAAKSININRGYLSNMLVNKCKNKTDMTYTMNNEYDSKK